MSIFLDVNIPMYAAGWDHPLKDPCNDILDLVARSPKDFCTDAEVLQEILHRYRSTGRSEAGRGLISRFGQLMLGRVEPVYASDVEEAASIGDNLKSLSARDLLHLAIIRRLGVSGLVTADTGFDGIPGLRRLDPLALETWRAEID